MDFGAVLHTAQKNEKSGKNEKVRYYNTKFEPPKKEQRANKQLSVNIKKFLARKEAEEKAKQRVELKKRDELLALRSQDKKAVRRVNVMLKRTKSANQSVISDAVDSSNTAMALAGSAQPDEDDYGYVSQEASAYYNKMMEKYSKMPDEPKFNLDKKKKVDVNLSSTKDRVRAALEQEKEEANAPHKRKRKHKEADTAVEETREEMVRDEPTKPKPKPKPKPLPPPIINFNDLLKIAQKKQFEPVVIEQKPKEEERPLTKKQKRELEMEKESRERREARLLAQSAPDSNKTDSNKPPPNKIPKLSNGKDSKANGDILRNCLRDPGKKPPASKPADFKKPQTKPLSNVKPPIKNQVPDSRDSSKSSKPVVNATVKKNNDLNLAKSRDQLDLKRKQLLNSKAKPFPPKDMQAKRPLGSQDRSGQLQPANRDLKPKQFPPSDVRRKEFPPRKPMMVNNKRRILDDDDEYDSEMDDFIDDGPQDGGDVSKFISEIFGYDKSKYRDVDDDIDNMESTFAQQMREESTSRKIGIMEDLEDIRREEEEKKRKARLKKRGKL